jgi:hypothetical protein
MKPLAGLLTLFATGIIVVARGAMALAALPASASSATESGASSEANGPFTIGGAEIRVEVDGAAFSAGSAPILEWVRRSAGIVAAYYGHFPTRTVHVQVVPQRGDGVNGGTTYGYQGGFIRVEVGRAVTDAQLRDDWVLVHEMVHLALPDVGEDHAWLSEGLATYVEGIARVQAGNRSEKDVWMEELRMMPRGLPATGDRGLDRTHTWGRTYWGGAMFCLLADVEIRKRTHLRLGLQDALRAVNERSGGLVADWPVRRVFEAGDAAVGTTALEDLYEQMKDDPMRPDLEKLWSDLGVERDGSNLRLHDDAPLAEVRHAIMRPPAPAPSKPEQSDAGS